MSRKSAKNPIFGDPVAAPEAVPETPSDASEPPDGVPEELMHPVEPPAVSAADPGAGEIEWPAADPAADQTAWPEDEAPEDPAVPGAEAQVDAEPATSDAVVEPAAPRGRARARRVVVRTLLILNLSMFGIMFLLPAPDRDPDWMLEVPGADDGPRVADDPGPVAPRDPEPAVSRPAPVPSVAPGTSLLDDQLYEQALVQALNGDFAEAARSLELYLERYPDMDPAVRRLVYDHVAYYLRKAGELEKSLRYENESRAMSGAVRLSDELIREARAAEARGDGVAMRRAYARFLLQQDQASPALRSMIVEAYLKLGDAYRMGALPIEARDEDREGRPR